jgi:hypothetical protein
VSVCVVLCSQKKRGAHTIKTLEPVVAGRGVRRKVGVWAVAHPEFLENVLYLVI